VYSPYIEDIFAFKKYPSIWQNRGALTHEQVKELEDYADQFHIEIIPVFETLGHFENILIKPEYVKFAEFPGAQVLNTTSEEAYSFLMDLIDDIAPAFRSPYFANAIPDIQYAAQSGYLAGAKGVSVSNWGDYGGETLRELIWYGNVWRAECVWSPLTADIGKFNGRFFRDFFGTQSDEITTTGVTQKILSDSTWKVSEKEQPQYFNDALWTNAVTKKNSIVIIRPNFAIRRISWIER
jgi:hypothetical protein